MKIFLKKSKRKKKEIFFVDYQKKNPIADKREEKKSFDFREKNSII